MRFIKQGLKTENYVKKPCGGIWKDEEVKSLFSSVEDCKRNNRSLKFAFELHAKKFKRMPNSVRNYYYKEVDNLLADDMRCNKLQINIDEHTKNHFVCFAKEEGESVLQEIENLTERGMSVRAACFKLANGDLAKMTRLQNKYQNMKKSNVIQFRKRQKVFSENELTSLFLGLAKLIKKNAIEEHLQKSNLGNENTEKVMKKAFNELNEKDSQIAQLLQEIKGLKQENAFLDSKCKSLEKEKLLKEHLEKKHISKMKEN